MGKFCTMEAHASAVEVLKLWKRPVLPPFAYSFQYFSPLRVSSLSILLWTKRNILPVLSLMTLHSLPRFHFTSVWVMIFTFPGNLKMILSQFLHRLGQRQMHGSPQYTCAEWIIEWETGMGDLIATTWVQVFCVMNKFELAHCFSPHVNVGDNLGFTQAVIIPFDFNQKNVFFRKIGKDSIRIDCNHPTHHAFGERTVY